MFIINIWDQDLYLTFEHWSCFYIFLRCIWLHCKSNLLETNFTWFVPMTCTWYAMIWNNDEYISQYMHNYAYFPLVGQIYERDKLNQNCDTQKLASESYDQIIETICDQNYVCNMSIVHPQQHLTQWQKKKKESIFRFITGKSWVRICL